jgi:hypothetical protein
MFAKVSSDEPQISNSSCQNNCSFEQFSKACGRKDEEDSRYSNLQLWCKEVSLQEYGELWGG